MPNYIICGTPRSGSTLVCEMLAASGVAGRPNSYFRPQDVSWWAQQWGISVADGTETAEFDREYLRAIRMTANAQTSVLGLRIMYSSLAEAQRRLNRASGRQEGVARALEQAFGPTCYIHLSRSDKLGQAVSLTRAEQTGLWHLRADGSVLEGSEVASEPRYDGSRIAAILDELEHDDRAWSAFFAETGIVPLRLTYEKVTENPQRALGDIFEATALERRLADTVETPTAKMADGLNAAWIARFRGEAGKGS